MSIARWILSLALVCGAAAPSPDAGAAPDSDGWTPLLDASMSKWDTYLSYRHKPGYTGKPPVDEHGNVIPPIGYGKNVDGVFTVAEENGQPVLRVSGEIYGCLFTKQEFENYRLQLQVKWGEKKWEPRTQLLRDSGVLYHSIGEAGAEYWRSWMLSQEFQIMEGHMGDYWAQASSAVDIRAFLPEGMMNSVASETQPFLPFGSGSPYGGFCLRSENWESPKGEWTTLDLICFGDKSVHVVNGHVVMVLERSRYEKDGTTIPLAKGKLQIQSEAAEVFYRNMRIRRIDAMPTEYARLFR